MCNTDILKPRKGDLNAKALIPFSSSKVKRFLPALAPKPGPPDTSEQDAIDAENAAAAGANLQTAASRRRRRLSSLFAGGRSVLGAPAGRGAPAGGGASGGGRATPVTSSLGGGARSYGGRGTGGLQP